MGVVQQIRLDQVFEIAFFCQFFQLIVDRKLLQVGERFVLVVQPAVEDVDAVHQALWEAGEVRLTETEFEIVDACLDGFLIHAVFHDILEGAADDGQEFFFLIFIGVLGYDGEEWLQDAVLVGTVNIFSDVCVKECLFDRGSRCVKECILQNGKCHV